MNNKILLIQGIAFLLFIGACNNKSNDTQLERKESTKNSIAVGSIIYDVALKPFDENDEWQKEMVAGINRDQYVDLIFEAVYNKKAIAKHYETNETLSLSKIKEIENDSLYSRSKIGKIQFYEHWAIDSANMTPIKVIDSIIPGYEAIDPNGDIYGYRAIFKIIYTHP